MTEFIHSVYGIWDIVKKKNKGAKNSGFENQRLKPGHHAGKQVLYH